MYLSIWTHDPRPGGRGTLSKEGRRTDASDFRTTLLLSQGGSGHREALGRERRPRSPGTRDRRRLTGSQPLEGHVHTNRELHLAVHRQWQAAPELNRSRLRWTASQQVIGAPGSV